MMIAMKEVDGTMVAIIADPVARRYVAKYPPPAIPCPISNRSSTFSDGIAIVMTVAIEAVIGDAIIP